MKRNSNLKSVALAATILVCSTALHSTGGPWEPGSLQGYTIWALEASPTGVMLAGSAAETVNKIFRSPDFGLMWTEATGLPGNEIWGIEFDPSNESIVYAALNGAGVYKSLDGGASWSWSNLNGQIWEIAVSPTHPEVLYVASQTGGVYKSGDAGDTWLTQDLGTVDNATAVAVHPTNPDIALAGTPFDGVFKTADGGATWLQVNAGFGFTPFITSLFINPQNPTTVYAGEFSDGVFKSLDGGLTWFRPDPTLSASVGEIKALDNNLYIIDAFELNNIPAYRSQDGGVTWEPLPRLPDLPGPLWPGSLEVVPGAVLIGTSPDPNQGGIYIWELPQFTDGFESGDTSAWSNTVP